MKHKREFYESLDSKELEERTALYENERGHLALGKLPSSTMADYGFGVLLILMVALFLITIGVFSSLGMLWDEEHLVTLAYLEAYPLIMLFLVGLHVVGYRYDELRKYRAIKKRSRSVID